MSPGARIGRARLGGDGNLCLGGAFVGEARAGGKCRVGGVTFPCCDGVELGGPGSWPRTAEQLRTAMGMTGLASSYWLMEQATGDFPDLIGSFDATPIGTFISRGTFDAGLNGYVIKTAEAADARINVGDVYRWDEGISTAIVLVGRYPVQSAARNIANGGAPAGIGSWYWQAETTSGGRHNARARDSAINSSIIIHGGTFLGAQAFVLDRTAETVQQHDHVGSGAAVDVTGQSFGAQNSTNPLRLLGNAAATAPVCDLVAAIVFRGAAAEEIVPARLDALLTYVGI